MKQTNIFRFTLIELLVVIAIIAILAGMLFPALHGVKDKGMTGSCISRTKQYYQVVSTYTMDYNDFVPGPYSIGEHRNSAGKLTYNSYFVNALVTLYSNALPRINKASKFWLCPALTPQAVTALDLAKNTTLLRYTYGINYSVRMQDYCGRISKIQAPARCASTGDSSLGAPQSNGGCNGNGGLSISIPDEFWRSQLRHDKKSSANFTFWDGHAETRHWTAHPNSRINSSKVETMKYTYFWQQYYVSDNEFNHL